MTHGRAYTQGGVVVALHVSSEPINIVMIDGCVLYDLTLSGQTSYDQVSLVNGAVVGNNVLTCNLVV